jgi:hypothetical protein
MINENIDEIQKTICNPESKDLPKDLKKHLNDCEKNKKHALEVSDLMSGIFR